MAEERNLATARAPEITNSGTELTKEELQRRMEEARESISQTVNDIKETVTTKYEDVRETISQSLDWREQFRRRPVAFAAGAAGVGLLLGYSIGGAVFGEGDDGDLASRYYGAEGEGAGHVRTERERSYAAQAITGGAYGSTAYAAPSQHSVESAAQAFDRSAERDESQQPQANFSRADNYTASASSAQPAPRPSYSSGYDSQGAAQAANDEPEEDDKPSLYSRFKETQAYDKLQQEVGNLGNRFVEELSKTAQNVVLPALLGKLKDMIGIDLSAQREVAQRSRLEQQASSAKSAADTASSGSGSSSSAASGAGIGGYGKSL